jgi:hypothetical protein
MRSSAIIGLAGQNDINTGGRGSGRVGSTISSPRPGKMRRLIRLARLLRLKVYGGGQSIILFIRSFTPQINYGADPSYFSYPKQLFIVKLYTCF